MLLKHSLSFSQIFAFTWKVDLLLLACCTLVYFLDTRLFFLQLSIPSSISAVLGTAIAFFIGFNNNQAYDRWWEARKIWGALTNDSRSWARSLWFYNTNSDPANKMFIRHMIYRHLAFVYALKAVLRRRTDDYYTRYLSQDEILAVRKETNVPNAILNLQSRDLQILRNTGAIDAYAFLELDQLLVKHCDSYSMPPT